MSPNPFPNSAAKGAALVDRARAGDRASFGELFRLHVGRVHRMVYRLVGPSPEIEDLVQTVFVEGFRSISTFRGEALFSTWLTRIAVRVCMRAVSGYPARPLPLEMAAGEPHPGPDPDAAVDARCGLQQLNRILETQSAKRRVAFVLHVLEGHPLEEVAAMVGASVAAVKVRVYDARRDIERRARRDPCLSAFLAKGEGPQ